MPLPIKTNRRLKLSRKEEMQRNPVVWIGVIAFTLVLSFVYIIPNTLDWQQKRAESQELKVDNLKLEKESKNLQIQSHELSLEFQEASKDFLIEESQRLPSEIETDRIAKVLEIYTWLLERTGEENSAQLLSINFGATNVVENQNYYQTSSNISLNLSNKNLKAFINFLQKGHYEESLKSHLKKRFQDQYFYAEMAMNFDFLDYNFLPTNHIKSININETKTKDALEKMFKVQMQVNFYSLEDPNGYSFQRTLKSSLSQ